MTNISNTILYQTSYEKEPKANINSKYKHLISSANSIQECIKEAGFEPQLRTQHYVEREMPEMEQQVIDY